MDIYYFKDQIIDEIEGAKQYIKNALEIKPMNSDWSKRFYEMSLDEMKHAAALFKMTEEYYKIMSDAYPEVPKYIKTTYEYIVNKYTEMGSLVKAMQDMYK